MKKIGLLVVGFLLLAVGCGGAWAHWEEPTPIVYLYQYKLHALGSGVEKAIKKGRITYADYEKLDFSFKGDPDFGVDPQYELFNPDGLFPRDKKKGIDEKKLYTPAYITAVVTKPVTRITLNLRRMIDKETGLITDRLYAIVPNIDPKACEGLDFDPEGIPKIKKPDWNFMIAPDNSKVVVDEKRITTGACVEMPDGVIYAISYVTERNKDSEDGEWRLNSIKQ